MIRNLSLALSLGLAFLAVGGGAAADAGSSQRLVAFRSCPDMLAYAKAQAGKFVGAYGFGGRPIVDKLVPGVANSSVGAASSARAADSTPTQGVDYSGTNVQETGVDEPDIVKTNGNTLFAIAGGQLQSVDVSGKTDRK